VLTVAAKQTSILTVTMRADRMQNRELHVLLNKAREEVLQERSKAAESADTPTYTQQKAQAKLDAEAQIEIAKYKRLYTGGAERLGRLQQEKEKLGKDLSAAQSERKELQGKVALLQDQLRSYHKSVRLRTAHTATPCSACGSFVCLHTLSAASAAIMLAD